MEMNIIRKQVQIVHPEKVFNYLPNLTDNTLAPLFGLSVDEYKKIKESFLTEVTTAANTLLSCESFKSDIIKLPFVDQDTVLVLGESNTDDFQSWFEILKAVITQSRSGGQIKFINAAVSGQTTTMALRSLTANLSVKPTWVICMLGMNDALRIGGVNGKTVVSLDETKRNLDFIHQLSKKVLNLNWVWITPYEVDEQKQDTNQWFSRLQLKWFNADLTGIRDHLVAKNDIVVDLQNSFKGSEDEMLMDDGVHASYWDM
jgi:acyl-CoA thioesterase-1